MIFKELFQLIKSRKEELPEESYVASLFKSGKDRVAQKVGEEAVEVVIAAKNNDKKTQISEISDLCFHTMILMAELDITIEDISKELESRKK